MNEKIEQTSRLSDPEFLNQIKEAIAYRLEEMATDPKLAGTGFSLDLGKKIRNSEKVPASIMIEDAIAGIGDDFRLNRDEIDVLKNTYLEKAESEDKI